MAGLPGARAQKTRLSGCFSVDRSYTARRSGILEPSRRDVASQCVDWDGDAMMTTRKSTCWIWFTRIQSDSPFMLRNPS